MAHLKIETWSNSDADPQCKLTSELSKVQLNANNKTVMDNDSIENSIKADESSLADASILAKVIRTGLVVNKNDIEVQRHDPSSPLYYSKTFNGMNIPPNLLRGMYEMGFNAPSKIQEAALPILLTDPPQNLIAQSQSGTGKTAAFLIAMLTRINPALMYPQALCLSPTYELAIQTGEVAARMTKYCPEIQMKFAVRGEDIPLSNSFESPKLSEHIIIGTPGKVLDWTLKYSFFDLKKLTIFVLDEADVMINAQGHQNQCCRITKELTSTCQTMFFSATYNQEVMEFAEVIVKNPITISLKREEQSLDNIKQYYVKCRNAEDKYRALVNIYGSIGIGQAIIFCHTKRTANWLADSLMKDGHAVAVLSSDLSVEQRIAVLDRFRSGQEKVLVTTNVLSRGIDVEQVTIVVNFELPMDQRREADCDTYLHRIGRTGRFGKLGIAINLIDSQQSMKLLRTIEQHFKRQIHLLNCDDSDEIEQIVA